MGKTSKKNTFEKMIILPRQKYIRGEPVLIDGYWHVARYVEGEDEPRITPYGFPEKYMAEDYIKNCIIDCQS